MEDAITVENRGDFGQWAIKDAKQIVSRQGFELARSACDGSKDDVSAARNMLGQAITNVLLQVYDGLLDNATEE